MKKLLLFSALISLTIFAACNKQEMEDDFVPANQESSALSTNDKTDDHGCNNTANVVTADFTINNEKGQVYESENLLLTNKSVNAVSYVWDFGNGDKSTEANPLYRYKIHGNYTVTLKTTDAQGNFQQTSHNIEVLCIFGGGSHSE